MCRLSLVTGQKYLQFCYYITLKMLPGQKLRDWCVIITPEKFVIRISEYTIAYVSLYKH